MKMHIKAKLPGKNSFDIAFLKLKTVFKSEALRDKTAELLLFLPALAAALPSEEEKFHFA